MKINSDKIKPIIFFLSFAFVIILIWFKSGLAFGGGDVGLPTYNPQRVFEIVRYIWWEAAAPGFVLSQSVINIPFEFLLSLLQAIGFSNIILQILLFFSFFFLMGYGGYLFALSIIGEKNKLLAYIAAIFYLLNPYTMIVWHRFLHTSIFFLAILPFFILTWRKWIKEGKIIDLVVFLLINFLSVYIYGTLAFVLSIWLLMFLVTISEILLPWKDKNNLLKLSLRFIFGFVLWVFVNSWWIIPTFSVGPSTFSQQHSTDESIVTLINISKQSILPYALQLVNPFYIYYQLDFGDIYKSLPFLIIPWIGTLFIWIGVFLSLFKKEFVKIGFIFVIIFTIAKGAASPFGYPFIFGFSHFFQLGVLRNPFEKIGIILPLFGSVLFVLGLDFLSKLLNKHIRKTYLVFLLFLSAIYFIFSWPILSGKIFGTINNPPVVKIPDSYFQADSWIKEDIKNNPTSDRLGKILHLPLVRDEALTYKWEYGYSGLEPSPTLFTSLPSISKGFNLTRLDDSLTALSLVFQKPYLQDKEKILKLVQDFNIRYVILHKDVVWEGGNLVDPKESEVVLENLDFLEKVATFGDLIIYRINDKSYKPKIEFLKKVDLIYPSDQMTFWPWFAKDEQSDFVALVEGDENVILEKNSGMFIFPKKTFVSSSSPVTDYNSIMSELERIQTLLIYNGELPSEILLKKIILATQKLTTKGSDLNASSFSDYQKLIKEIFEKLDSSRLTLYVNQLLLSNLFQYHLLALEQLNQNQILSYLKEKLIEEGLIPSYKISNQSNIQVYTYRFQIPKQQSYEILMVNGQGVNIYPNNLHTISLQVNDQIISMSSKPEGELISFGKVDLPAGISEVSFEPQLSVNLAKNFENQIINIDSVTSPSFIEIPLISVRGGDIYLLNFELKVEQANGFYIQLLQDTDSRNQNGQQNLQVNEFVSQDAGDWKNYNLTIPPIKLTTKEAKLRIFTSNSKVLVRNLKVQRILNNSLFLKATGVENKDNEVGGEILSIERKNPVKYRGVLKVSKPGFIFFKETYHSGWSLKLSSQGKEYTVLDHYLGNLYGNAWYIDKEGEYNFVLEFTPQKIVKLGFILTAIIWIGLFIFLLKNKINNE